MILQCFLRPKVDEYVGLLMFVRCWGPLLKVEEELIMTIGKTVSCSVMEIVQIIQGSRKFITFQSSRIIQVFWLWFVVLDL